MVGDFIDGGDGDGDHDNGHGNDDDHDDNLTGLHGQRAAERVAAVPARALGEGGGMARLERVERHAVGQPDRRRLPRWSLAPAAQNCESQRLVKAGRSVTGPEHATSDRALRAAQSRG